MKNKLLIGTVTLFGLLANIWAGSVKAADVTDSQAFKPTQRALTQIKKIFSEDNIEQQIVEQNGIGVEKSPINAKLESNEDRNSPSRTNFQLKRGKRRTLRGLSRIRSFVPRN